MSELDGSPTGALRRVGHKGADLIAPGNTFASFDAALEAGVDMIEFDVLPERAGRSADPRARLRGRGGARRRTRSRRRSPTLAGERFAGVELDVDLKLPGYELRVLDALRDHGVLERALISTQYRESLELLRAADPRSGSDGRCRS